MENNKQQLNHSFPFNCGDQSIDVDVYAILNDKGKATELELKATCNGSYHAYSYLNLDKPCSIKGKLIKDLMTSARQERYSYIKRVIQDVAFYSFVYWVQDQLDKSPALPRLKYTSNFYTSRMPGYYLMSPNCKYKPGKLNCVNIICQGNPTKFRLEVTDGYNSHTTRHKNLSLEEAYLKADELITQGHDYLDVA